MARDRYTRRRRLAEQPLSRVFPNMITLAGLCCGLSAIRFAITGKWELAVAFLVAAAIIDGMDGRIARMLGATSEFGAQLDSLSDFICFGVAPALVMYLWQLHDIRGLGWALTLFFAVCCALRLARFNTNMHDPNQQPWQKQFFTGVPSPAGGLLCLIPLMLQFDRDLTLPTYIVMPYVFLIAVLMASRVPTFAAKNMRIKTETILPFMIISALVLVMLVIEPWLTFSVLGGVYLLSIPLSVRHYRKLQRAALPQPE